MYLCADESCYLGRNSYRQEDLILYAADTKDRTVIDTFVQLLRSRKPA